MLNILLAIITFLSGLVVGSFLNSVIYRLEEKEGFLFSRSYCPHCKHGLAWYDLIPVLSFIILRAKCRYCSKSISWQYPIVEAATGLLFLIIFNFQFSDASIFNKFLIYNFQTISDALFLFIIACFLIIIFVYDLKHYIIPDKVIYPAIAITFLYRLFGISELRVYDLFRISDFGFRIFAPLTNPLLSAVLASAFFLAIVLISRGRWMGVGDIKLAFLLGLFLGWPDIAAALFLSFVLGAAAGTGLIAAKKKTLKSEIPFGPFLAAGALLTLFLGGKLIHWYLRLFFW